MKRNAISPVIAVILLVAITIGIAATAFSWMQSIQNPSMEKGTELASKQLGQVSGKLVIESVKANSSNTSYIYFRNIGTSPLSNFTLYLNGNIVKEEDITVDEGELGTINTTAITQAGETYKIKIVSFEGASVVKSVIAE